MPADGSVLRAIAGTIALIGLGLSAAQANKLAAGDLCYTTVMKYRARHHESRFPGLRPHPPARTGDPQGVESPAVRLLENGKTARQAVT